MKKHFVLILLIAMIHTVFGQNDSLKNPNISPLSFGLSEATTDSARYEVLYQTHVEARKLGVGVDYSGIETLSIEIPKTAKPIPLTDQTDFAGLDLHVVNRNKTLFLFELKQSLDTITIGKSLLGGKDFSSIEALAEGTHLLILQDEHPWVAKREGHSYSAIRKDVLLVCDGKAQNSPVTSYLTDSTKPKCFFCPATDTLKYVKNITFIRDSASTYKTKFLKLSGQNNVLVENVSIHTPPSTLTGDEAIAIEDCANITLQDVTIKGTYSRTDYYGYGIEMNNVLYSKFIRLNGQANWGIFGTNNLNEVQLMDCNINRFDVHCYCRNVTITNCKFTKLYNQFSSVYGNLVFDGCRFKNFVPVLFEPSYNSYTGFDLVFKDCVFDVTTSRNFFISAGYLDDKKNTRPELAKKCWPNVSMTNVIVNVPDNVYKVILFNVKGTVSKKYSVGNISKVRIDGLKFNYSGSGHAANFILSNADVSLSKSFACTINDMDILPYNDDKIVQGTTKYSYPASVTFNMHHDLTKDVVKISNSRLNYNVNINAQYNINYTKCTIGMVRYTPLVNSTRRNYSDCKIYLNCCDDRRYYIDNHASYNNCLFIPCNHYMVVDFYGSNNNVTLTNCRSSRVTPLIFKGRLDNSDLKNYSLVGRRK